MDLFEEEYDNPFDFDPKPVKKRKVEKKGKKQVVASLPVIEEPVFNPPAPAPLAFIEPTPSLESDKDSDSDYVGNDIEKLFEQKANERPKRTKKPPKSPKEPKESKKPAKNYFVKTLSLASFKEDEPRSDISPITVVSEDDWENEPDDDNYCFACAWADYSALDGDDINTMLRMIDEGYMKYNDKDLALDIHNYYMKNIYPVLRKHRKDVKKWTVTGILRHFEHVKEPRFYIARMMKMYQSLMDFLLQNIVNVVHNEASGTDINCVNGKLIDLILKIEGRSTVLMEKDPKKMNFFNEKCTLDFANVGKFVNVNSFMTGRQK